MATLTAVNPRIVSGPTPSTTKLRVADNTTWKAGQWLTASGGYAVAVASDATSVKYFALADLTDQNNSTTEIKVGIIDPDHVFRINALDGAVDAANIGVAYGIDVTSNVVTLDVAETSSKCVIVVDRGETRSPVEFDDTDTKGVAYVRVLQRALDA